MKRMRPSPAMVVAFVALIMSVTGGAYAAITINTSNIVDGAVTHPKLSGNSVWHTNIGTRSVRNVNINDGAVNNRNMAPNSVWHAQIGTGSVRRNNMNAALIDELRGATGPAGPPGANGVTGYEVFASSQSFGSGGIGGTWCGAPTVNTANEGWEVVGGGADLTDAQISAGVVVANSWPNLADPNNPGWNIRLNNANSVPGEVTVYAVCVKSSP